MRQVGRYGLGAYGGAPRPLGEMRQVYEYRGATVYIDHQSTTHRVEVFAYIGTGMLWFVAGFWFRNWVQAERKAQAAVDKWIETQENDR